MPVLMEPVPVPAPAQVAPGCVDALMLAPAIVLGTLVLVCGGRQAIREKAPLGIPSRLRAPLKGHLRQGGSLIVPGWVGAASAEWYMVLLYTEFPTLLKHLNEPLCPLTPLPAKTRGSLKGRLILRRVVVTIIKVTAMC